MFSRILIYSIIVCGGAFAVYWQHKQIVALQASNKILAGNIDALEDFRDEDQKRIAKYAAQVSQVKNEREDLMRKMGEMRNAKVDDFLDTPVPDELRDIAEAYIAGRNQAGKD